MPREEQAAATRAELLRVARELFAARGYADVGTEEIVRAAHVTRGALYHHFADKRDLFRAVHAQLAERAARPDRRADGRQRRRDGRRSREACARSSTSARTRP